MLLCQCYCRAQIRESLDGDQTAADPAAKKSKARAARPKKSKASPPAGQSPTSSQPHTPCAPATTQQIDIAGSAQLTVAGSTVVQTQIPAGHGQVPAQVNPGVVASSNQPQVSAGAMSTPEQHVGVRNIVGHLQGPGGLQPPTVMVAGGSVAQPSNGAVSTVGSSPAVHLVTVSLPASVAGGQQVITMSVPQAASTNMCPSQQLGTNCAPVVASPGTGSVDGAVTLVTQQLPPPHSMLAASLLSAPISSQPQMVIQRGSAPALPAQPVSIASAQGLALQPGMFSLPSTQAASSPAMLVAGLANGSGPLPVSDRTLLSTNTAGQTTASLSVNVTGSSSISPGFSQLQQCQASSGQPVTPSPAASVEDVPRNPKTVASLLRQRQNNPVQVS